MLLADPQLATRRHYHFPRHDLIGEIPVDAAAFRMAGVEPRITPGPRYATASSDALKEWLALGDDEIAELLASGVVTFE